MNYEENLPDVSQWKPDANKQEILKNALMMTCQVAQRRIVARTNAEIEFNINNFDSGLGVEDIVREELANLLPQRYRVDAGIVNDRSGQTAGDCDLAIRDNIWSSVIKLGATDQSRRFHFPIEGLYAAAEIKQTISLKEIDEAMRKLVVVSRLERPQNPYGHITENQHIPMFDRKGSILNPLHTTVLGTKLAKGLTFDGVARRFGAVNALLERDHMVNMLCVLDHGTAWYSVLTGSPYNATFMRDRGEPLILQINNGEPQNAFYRFYVELAGHLTRSILGLTDVEISYGAPPPHRDVVKYPDAVFNKT